MSEPIPPANPQTSDPLTPEEVTKAADRFFPLFEIVHKRMPEGSTIEDTLKVFEPIGKLAFKMRADDKRKKRTFGFNKLETKEAAANGAK